MSHLIKHHSHANSSQIAQNPLMNANAHMQDYQGSN